MKIHLFFIHDAFSFQFQYRELVWGRFLGNSVCLLRSLAICVNCLKILLPQVLGTRTME